MAVISASDAFKGCMLLFEFAIRNAPEDTPARTVDSVGSAAARVVAYIAERESWVPAVSGLDCVPVDYIQPDPGVPIGEGIGRSGQPADSGCGDAQPAGE